MEHLLAPTIVGCCVVAMCHSPFPRCSRSLTRPRAQVHGSLLPAFRSIRDGSPLPPVCSCRSSPYPPIGTGTALSAISRSKTCSQCPNRQLWSTDYPALCHHDRLLLAGHCPLSSCQGSHHHRCTLVICTRPAIAWGASAVCSTARWHAVLDLSHSEGRAPGASQHWAI
jgi:hypothetical protein